MFLDFSRGLGGFRGLREAYRNHFHLSWYLSVPVVTSYSQKPSWGIFFTVYSICRYIIPTPPHIVNNVEKGLRDRDDGREETVQTTERQTDGRR